MLFGHMTSDDGTRTLVSLNPGRDVQRVGTAHFLGEDVEKIHDPVWAVLGNLGDSQCYLGVTAKAVAADRAASRAASAAGCGVLVGLGGDIAVAGPAPDGGWRIRICDDHRAGPDTPGQTVAITDGGLATSSVTVRRWRRGGRMLHHIVDPATGAPAGAHWRTVSVAAATCLDSNAASTAALVKGRAAADWLAHQSLPARLAGLDGVVLSVAGWPR